MNKEELLKAIEQKRQEVRPTDTGEMKPAIVPNNLELCWLNALNWMEDFINSLPAEQPSEELEYLATSLEETIGTSPHSRETIISYLQQAAQWQKEQMMKSAIDAVIVNDEMSGCVVDCEQGCLVLEPHRYPIGQKLKILILEDKQ